MKKDLVLIDDQFPINQVGGSDTDSFDKFHFKKMIKLNDYEWSSQGYLKQLVRDILSSNFIVDDLLNMTGFCHPEILLQKIENENFNPDVIVYDWEYMTGSDQSDSNLLSILNQTSAFIFIYSNLPSERGLEHIPTLIGDSNFDKHSHRIQLLGKGDQEASIFGSEGFILQYLNSIFYKSYTISLGTHSIEFEESGYLKNASDILYLEMILGKEFIFNELKGIDNKINNSTVIKLFERSEGKLYVNKERSTVVIRQTDRIERMYGPLSSVSYVEALEEFGFDTILNAVERGVTKVKNNGITNNR